MSTSSSLPAGHKSAAPITLFSYRDIADPATALTGETPAEEDRQRQGLAAQELEDLVNRVRAEAVAQTESRLRAEYEVKSNAEAEKIRRALELFLAERKDYFCRVESDVVQLALSIAAKILHREAQVDSLLVAALVRVAIEKLHDGSSVSLRVSPSQAVGWRTFFANPLNGTTVEIVEDVHLGPDDCVLETDLGSANFSIDAQLKEVEQGLFDLLAQRPAIK
jgi:flagellar assembly protein FliH